MDVRPDGRTFERTFVRSFVRTDGWTEILPCVLWDIVPFGTAAENLQCIINRVISDTAVYATAVTPSWLMSGDAGGSGGGFGSRSFSTMNIYISMKH